MAPIKFEEHVKEKLDERKIQPSAGSWDQLNSRLNNDTDKNSGRKWWVSAVAAGAILLIASTFFLKQQGQMQENPVVETPVDETIQDDSQNTESKKAVEIASEEVSQESVQKIEKSTPKTEVVKTQDALAENNAVEESREEEESVVVSENYKFTKPVINEPIIVQNSSEELNERLQEVIQKISEEEKNSGSYTNAEVDALLAEAAAEISEERSLYKEGSIDAAALLADVEYEVDESFRKEVFDFLKAEFLKAKTAVANRND